MNVKLSLFIFFIAVNMSIPRDADTKAYVKFKMNQLLEKLNQGELPIEPYLRMVSAGSPVFAEGGGGDPSCEKQDSVRAKCSAAWNGTYLHGALGYFNGTLCRFNNETAAEVENVLCHFRKSMGINVDLNSLPVSATKTFGNMTVVVDIAAPTDAWATALGYQAKGTVTVNGSVYMVLYWGGKEEKSKGFMIEGYQDGGLGGRRAGYMAWDLTNSDSQWVKMYKANFPSGAYLTSAAKSATSYRGDAAIYGAISFNKSTSAVSAQVVLIEEQRFGGTAGSFGCFRMYSAGTKNGQITVAKTQNSFGGSGHSVGHSVKILNEMDGVTLTDSVSTADGTGTSLTTQGALETALGVSGNVFHVSCANLSAGTSSSGASIFATSVSMVDFTKALADIFPN